MWQASAREAGFVVVTGAARQQRAPPWHARLGLCSPQGQQGGSASRTPSTMVLCHTGRLSHAWHILAAPVPVCCSTSQDGRWHPGLPGRRAPVQAQGGDRTLVIHPPSSPAAPMPHTPCCRCAPPQLPPCFPAAAPPWSACSTAGRTTGGAVGVWLMGLQLRVVRRRSGCRSTGVKPRPAPALPSPLLLTSPLAAPETYPDLTPALSELPGRLTPLLLLLALSLPPPLPSRAARPHLGHQGRVGDGRQLLRGLLLAVNEGCCQGHLCGRGVEASHQQAGAVVRQPKPLQAVSYLRATAAGGTCWNWRQSMPPQRQRGCGCWAGSAASRHGCCG